MPSDDVENIIRQFSKDANHSTLLIVDPECALTREEGVEYGIRLCELLRDIEMVAICVHPNDDFAIQGFQTRSKIPFVTMLVQTDELVRHAKDSLRKTHYYDNWSKEALVYNHEQFARFLREQPNGELEIGKL